MEPAADLKTRLDMADVNEVAALQNMTVDSLRNQRNRGEGPPYTRIGSKVFYPLKSLRKYIAAQTITPKKTPTLVDGARKRKAMA